VSGRGPWFLPRAPDVLGILGRHADVVCQGLEALERWSRDGDPADAQGVRDAEHDGDALRAELLEALTEALTTPIDQEDAYALSERIDEVVDCAKDVVRLAAALGWSPDEHAAAMAARAAESAGHLRAAIRNLGHRREHPGDHAEQAIKSARRVEHELLEGLAALRRDGDGFERAAALEVYRAYSRIGQALLRAADRTWYAVLKVL
jgi:uncharacterized protein Yka (UPF0111/DUF47 family)